MAQQAKLDRYSQLLATLYEQGTSTRTALSDTLNWSRPTVNRLVGELRDLNLIVEDDTQANGRGRPSDVLRINPEHGYALGVEFGTDLLQWVVVDAVGAILAHDVAEAVPFRHEFAVLDLLAERVCHALEVRGFAWNRVLALTIAFHDVVTTDGHWIPWGPDAFTRVKPLPVSAYLQKKLCKPVRVEDYSRALAEAEHRYGASRGVADTIYLFISDYGIGSGIFANDRLLKPSLGVCGEVAHVVVEEGGTPCMCGNRGCLCTVAAGVAVVERVKARLEQNAPSRLTNDLTFEKVCQAFQQGDPTTHEVFAETAQHIARALGNTVNITGTPNVVIGGPLKQAGEAFLSELKNALEGRVIPVLTQHINVSFASLPAYAGAFGAALQALDAYWQEVAFVDERLTSEAPTL